MTQRVYLTVREVAHLLNLNVNTVYRYVWTGKLKHVKVGTRTVRIHINDVKPLLTPQGAEKLTAIAA